VEDHRNRNPQPRVPDPAALSKSREGLEQHLRELDERRNTGCMAPVTVHISDPQLTPQGSVPSGVVSIRAQNLHRRVARNTLNPPTESNATGVMLRYYKSEWQAVLKNAKNLYRFWLATEHPYPSAAQGYVEAHEVIQEAIADFRIEGGVLESASNTFHPVLLSTFLVDDIVTTDMRRMVSLGSDSRVMYLTCCYYSFIMNLLLTAAVLKRLQERLSKISTVFIQMLTIRQLLLQLMV
jgi:hypothetical protein